MSLRDMQIGAHPTAVVVPIVIIAVLIAVIFLAVGPGGLMVRVSGWYSECLGFESQLDPRFFFYFSLSAKIKNHHYFMSAYCHLQ